MYIQLDLSTLPATAQLLEPEEFGDFRVALHLPAEIWIQPQELLRVAASRAQDAGWRTRLDAMVNYAASRGWVREDGAILAHVEQLA